MTIFFCVLMGQRQIFSRLSRPLNQACNEKLLVLFSSKTYGVGMQKNRFNRPFFSAPKTNVKIDGKEIFSNITLQLFVYQNLITCSYLINYD